ncbi:MAG: hypothetical protein D6796_13815, partial [Caldilineae bacterium]
AQALRGAGFAVRVYADYRSLKWSKLLLNLIANAIPAILDMPPAAALAHPAIFNLELAALRETLAVMRAQGIAVVSLPAYPLPALAMALRLLPDALLRLLLRPLIAGGRGEKLPSLLLDARRGRNQSEVNVLNRVVAERGERLNIPAPVNRGVSDLLNGILQGTIPRSAYQNNPEALIEYFARAKDGG